MSIVKLFKKVAGLLTGMALVVGLMPATPVMAAQAVEDCVLYAQGSGESIYVQAGHINMNGDIVTNGKFTTTLENPGINGTIYENQQNAMPDYAASIQNLYFNGEVNYVEGDYFPEDVNENISKAMEVNGAFTSSGKNIAINGGALMTKGDVTVDGGSFSCSDGVIFSKEGNIHIATDNFSASALFYAPNGTVYIECGNINMNGCIVAQNIEIVSSGGVNLNKNQDLIRKFGQVIQADEALNDTEDNNYVESRDPGANQQGSNDGQAVNNQQGSNNGQSANSQQGGNGQQATGNQQDNNGQQTSNNQQGTSGQQNNTEGNNAANTSEDIMGFEDVEKHEIKNMIDVFILIYQVWTGQKGVLIFDLD